MCRIKQQKFISNPLKLPIKKKIPTKQSPKTDQRQKNKASNFYNLIMKMDQVKLLRENIRLRNNMKKAMETIKKMDKELKSARKFIKQLKTNKTEIEELESCVNNMHQDLEKMVCETENIFDSHVNIIKNIFN